MSERNFLCRSCGLKIKADDAERTISHQVPECERFKELCLGTGGIRDLGGCPRHLGGSRDCKDFRCLQTWEPPGAPTPEEQLRLWAIGVSQCPNTRHECCPDFSCCNSRIGWPLEKRAKFMAAGQGEREKMMMGALGDVIADAGKKAYVTRGDPTDHE